SICSLPTRRKHKGGKILFRSCLPPEILRRLMHLTISFCCDNIVRFGGEDAIESTCRGVDRHRSDHGCVAVCAGSAVGNMEGRLGSESAGQKSRQCRSQVRWQSHHW